MPTYDLTTESWIPVVWLPAKRRPDDLDAVGLRDVLTEAHRIREVAADSPLETVAIYRLLQALFLRLYPESGTREAWFDLWHRGRFDAQRIIEYFDEWQGEKNRFDLFDERRPFYGHCMPKTQTESSSQRLFQHTSSGNNPTLFDHTTDEDSSSISPARAARGVLATQALALSGGKSGSGYYSDGPLLAGAIFWLQGSDQHDSLFHALMLNTPPATRARIDPWDDDPAWERTQFVISGKHSEEGYLDYLTWPTRRLRLETGSDMVERKAIVRLWISQGVKWQSKTEDPLMAKRYEKDRGVKSFRFKIRRHLWRDAHVLMGTQLDSKKVGTPPSTFSWFANNANQLASGGSKSGSALWRVDAFGLAKGDSNVVHHSDVAFVRHERLPIYLRILRSLPLQNALKDALTQAEKQKDNLRRACRVCAKKLVKLKKSKEITGVVQALGAEPRYWATLGSKFEVWVDGLARLEDPEPEGEYASDAFQQQINVHIAYWTKRLYKAANKAYEDATASLAESPRQFEAVARGRNELRPVAAFQKILDDA